MAKTENKGKPIEIIRIGSIQATIWSNQGAGVTWFNVTFQRVYHDREKGWRYVSSFGRDDLLVLKKVADEAHTRVVHLIGAQRQAQRQKQPAA